MFATDRAPLVPPTGTVTFLFTDIEGSTRLLQEIGDAYAEVLAQHRRVLRTAFAAHDGVEMGTEGDSFFVAFARASDAVAAAAEGQRGLAGERVRVRMGLHSGEPLLTAEGYVGMVVHRAARIAAAGHGGQVLLSQAVADLVGDRLPLDVALRDLGNVRLKDLKKPERVYQVLHPQLQEDFPALRSLEATPNNLPAERDAFVGRTLELHALAQRLEKGARLTTVLGLGGTGKTRFVRRYGRLSLGDWPGGVCFCDLSEARSLEGIMSAVAVALDVPLANSDAGAQLGHAIAARGRCLVVLDNFEHLREHAATTLGRWAERAADAVFVVTSRERLHLPGEEIFPLEPLPLDKDAIDLFVVRAQAQRSEFALSATNREDVGRIVRLVDGLPLAIELAAARVRVLSPAQLVERMRDRFALLADARGAIARQATLRAAIDWSWNLLVPWEQAALAQCAVFEGGFTLETAEQVIDLSAWPHAPPAMDAVQALVDKSLLRTWVPVGGIRYDLDEIYFGMYVSIHEYAGEKLRALGPADERGAEQRHGRCFAAFGADAAVEALYRRDGSRRRQALAFELDNIVAACRRAVARGDAETAVATYRASWEVLDLRGPFAVAAALGTQVLGLAHLDASQRARTLVTRARTSLRAGQPGQARPLLEQVLMLAQEAGDRRLELIARCNLGRLLCTQGRMDESRIQLEAALALLQGSATRRIEGTLLINLGRLYVDQGQVEQGQVWYERALAIQRELGNRIGEASALHQIAVMLGQAGRLQEARAHFEESLAISQELGDRVAEGEALNNLGCLLQDQGRLDEARSTFEEALAIHREVGNRRFEGYALGDLGRLHCDQGRLVEARACLEQALAIMRETADRRTEADELRSLGEVYLLEGHGDDAARAMFEQAEAVLREAGDKHYLALVLCGRGEVERRAGDFVSARATCAEAQALAGETRAGPDSQLSRKIAALQEMLP